MLNFPGYRSKECGNFLFGWDLTGYKLLNDSSLMGFDALSTLNALVIPGTVYLLTGFANDYQLSLISLLVSLSVAVQASNNQGNVNYQGY
jgi:hypothetical protein